MGIDYITVLTWLKYWILQLPPPASCKKTPETLKSFGGFAIVLSKCES